MRKPKPKSATPQKPSQNVDDVITKAHRLWDARRFREAYRMFLLAATRGDTDAQVCVGLMTVAGHGTRKDTALAMKWYKAAAGAGSRMGASNAARMYLNKGQKKLALRWYLNAVRLHDGDARVDAARLLIGMHRRREALTQLRFALRASKCDITDFAREEAQMLIKQITSMAG